MAERTTGAAGAPPSPYMTSTEREGDPSNPLTDYERRRVLEQEADLATTRAAASTGEGKVNRIPAPIDAAPRPRQNMNGFKIAAGSVVDDGAYSAPIDFHPGNVENIDGYEDHKAYLAPAHAALTAVFDGLNAISEGRKQALQNPAWNEYQVLLQAGTFAEKTHAKICKAFDHATDTLTKGIADIDRQLTGPLTSQAASPFAKEIRDHVKGIKDTAMKSAGVLRGEFLAAAMERNDTGAIHALLGSPAYLSGLPESAHAHHLRKYQERNNPGLLGRQTAMRAALAIVEQNAPRVHTHTERALGGKFATLQKVRKANTAAEKALAFDAADKPILN